MYDESQRPDTDASVGEGQKNAVSPKKSTIGWGRGEGKEGGQVSTLASPQVSKQAN